MAPRSNSNNNSTAAAAASSPDNDARMTVNGAAGNDRDARDFDSREIAERRGLLPAGNSNSSKKKGGVSLVRKLHDRRLRALLDEDDSDLPRGRQRQRRRRRRSKDDWMRPYWLGLALFLVLFPFWLLDTLKDPVFGALIFDGNLQEHQPTAKLFSVCTTLALVCFLEYLAQERRRVKQQQQQQLCERDRDDVLDGGGRWNRMGIATSSASGDYDGGFYWNDDDEPPGGDHDDDGQDRVPSSIFASMGVPYCIFFGIVAYLLQFNPATALTPTSNNTTTTPTITRSDTQFSHVWHVLGYCLYAAIESYGSLAVATFWSYTNSTLSLADAEAYYGTIIALAQMGAIAGSTLVTMHVWTSVTLFVVACLVMVLHILVMVAYARRFPPTSPVAASAGEESEPAVLLVAATDKDPAVVAAAATAEPSLWSGVHLMLRHNYVLLILGVSCLYEVSLTCLNYQMTLLGWSRFAETPDYNPDQSNLKSMSFTQFMGRYGQMVNISSLILSSIVFPQLIQRLGLKYTLRLFPTLLLLVNVVAFGALPGNLTVLFFSVSLLKAMTYSIHDPSKEILYIPTSNAIKFKSKFWIDVVGARFAKAIGSSINTYAGSVDRSIRVASAPSLMTAVGLWFVCYRIGRQFEHLVTHQMVVGRDDVDPLLRLRHDLSVEHADDDDGDGDGRGDMRESTTDAMELTAL